MLFFFVLTACGHTQSADVELTLKEQTKTEVPKEKNVLAVLGCNGPSHLCFGSKDFDFDAYRIDRTQRQKKVLVDNPNMRPHGEGYPVATIDGCDNVAKWDDKKVLDEHIILSLREMAKDTKRDCIWSTRFLQCGGALLVIKSYDNEVMREVKKVKEDYRACTPANM